MYDDVKEVSLYDDRRTNVYVLREWSTAAFASGDYDLSRMAAFKLDLEEHLIWIEYGYHKVKKLWSLWFNKTKVIQGRTKAVNASGSTQQSFWAN